jgi:hypothetical protein
MARLPLLRLLPLVVLRLQRPRCVPRCALGDRLAATKQARVAAPLRQCLPERVQWAQSEQRL